MTQKISSSQVFAWLFTIIGGILMIANVWWSQESPMGKVGATILIVILTAVWGLVVKWIGQGCLGWGTVVVISIVILLSGGDAWTRATGKPVAEVNIDNSVDVYPMPAEDSPDFPRWFEGKVGIKPGQGA